MITTSDFGAAAKAPAWFWTAGALGLAWNVYGVRQFAGTFSQTAESLVAAGMTADQAATYLALPAWTTLVFAVGVFGGLAGCMLLLLRRAVAVPVYAASLAGYAALFAGDVAYGVFAGNTGQLVILSFVVVVAAALLAMAWVARTRGIIV